MAIQIQKSRDRDAYHKSANALKLILLLGLIYLLMFSPLFVPMELLNKKLILGSKSPRRKHILEQACFHVDVVSFDVEEDYPDNLKEDEIAEYLAIKKHNPVCHYAPKTS